ncbi:MAG: hypothetical protein PVH50_08800 [Anaerolineae bacterium]|jgi:hypothetical protein
MVDSRQLGRARGMQQPSTHRRADTVGDPSTDSSQAVGHGIAYDEFHRDIPVDGRAHAAE